MSHDRNLKWLNDRRVIYRRDPITDIPTIETDQYKYYEDGTHEAYCLFNSKAKITTYKSLKWHLLVLYYLNENLLDLEFASICHFLADKNNGFVTFFIKSKVLHEMIKDVINQGGDPPKNKLRKVIFKPYSGLNLSGKLKIVGQLIGRSKIDNGMIYDAMLYIRYDLKQKVTISKIAKILGCSTRTIYRNMDSYLKIEKHTLNEEI
jgi:hypothetical protein|tara:strand:+ start:152 stop:769 length:618 start_codon:yes stop_codon:yes gene_type:complete